MSDRKNTSLPMTRRAAAFLEAHLDVVDQVVARRRFRRAYSNPEDFKQDVRLRVLEHFKNYKTDKPAGGFIHFCAMYEHTMHERGHLISGKNVGKAKYHVTSCEMTHEPASPFNDIEALEQQTDAERLVGQILAIATPLQAQACQTVMNGLTGKQVKEQLGVHYATRNEHIRRLRAQVVQQKISRIA